jgi:hypothetical protein
MAAGFIDNDSRTDLVTTNQEQNSFQVHYYDGKKNIYESSQSFMVDESSPDAKISSIVIDKADQEYQNLLVTYWKEADPTSSYVKVFKHTEKFIFEESTANQLNGLQMEGQSQMFMLDINGDML